jgi:hypothetical protein
MLREAFPNADIRLFYAVGEMGIVSRHCEYLSIGQYHSAEDVEIKINNPDEFGIGDIAVNIQISPSTHLDEYCPGDVGRAVGKKCQCGNPFTFEVVGRRDFDFIKINGALFFQKEFERVARELLEWVVDFRGTAEEVTENGQIKGKIHLQIIPTDSLRKRPDAADFCAREFMEKLFISAESRLADAVKDGGFLPLTVSFVVSFPHTHKDVKMKRIYAR